MSADDADGVLTPPANDDWRDRAACRGVNQSLFFPTVSDRANLEIATALCNACVVRDTCATVAMSNGERHGFWAGQTSSQRLSRERRWHGTPARYNANCRCEACVVARARADRMAAPLT